MGDFHEEGKVYKYCKLLRKTDEAVKSLFSDLVVVNEEGDAHKVPCIWADYEKTRAYLEQGSNELNLDGTLKITDKIKARLPLISVYSTDITMPASLPVVGYTVNIKTLFQEDMNQILEQIILKFDNKKNCKLAGVARNYSDGEVSQLRVLQSTFGITVEGIGVPVETHE